MVITLSNLAAVVLLRYVCEDPFRMKGSIIFALGIGVSLMVFAGTDWSEVEPTGFGWDENRDR